MKTLSISRYGVTVCVSMDEPLGCCGTRSIEGFQVRGNDSNLTEDQVRDILEQLYLRCRQYDKHIFVAADAGGAEGWSGGTVTSSRGTQLSLKEFCEVNKFKLACIGVNPNNGHHIYTYTDSYKEVTSAGTVTRDVPTETDPIGWTPPKSSDSVEAIADAIVQALSGQ